MAKTTTKNVKTAGNPDLYVEEFLYRGRRDGDDRPTGWHVILGLQGTDPLGRPHPHLGTLNSAQAVERGWDVPEIIADINTQVMGDLEAERAKAHQLEADLNQTSSKLENALKVAAALQAKLEEATAQVVALEAALAAQKDAALAAMAQPAAEAEA